MSSSPITYVIALYIRLSTEDSKVGSFSIEVGYFMEMVFPLYSVRFISINDDFDSDKLHGDTGGINVAFKYLVSEFYSRDLSIKYKSAKYVKFRRG